jgi:hypothetical protein
VIHSLVKRTLLLVGLVWIGVQFVPTGISQTSTTPTRTHMSEGITPQVGAILDRSCQDCHSGNTRWPWYSRIAPVSWLVARDVRRGRSKLDFSDWAGRYHSHNERMEICDAVSNGSMPIRMYTLIHRDARLTPQEVDRCRLRFLLGEETSLRHSSGEN